DVPVEAVVGDVESAVGEPAREGRVVPVEGLGKGRVPVEEFTRLIGPEFEPVGLGPVVQLGPRYRLCGKFGIRGKAPVLLKQAIDVAHLSLRASLQLSPSQGHSY